MQNTHIYEFIVWSEGNLNKVLAEGIALELYGRELTGSVTSFEQFASCQFAYFCQYGLGLKEREEYQFAVELIEKVGWDAGNKKAAPVYKRDPEDGRKSGLSGASVSETCL